MERLLLIDFQYRFVLLYILVAPSQAGPAPVSDIRTLCTGRHIGSLLSAKPGHLGPYCVQLIELSHVVLPSQFTYISKGNRNYYRVITLKVLSGK